MLLLSKQITPIWITTYTDNVAVSLGENLPPSNALPDGFTRKLQNASEKQDFSTIQINNAINVLENRSGLATFLVGNNLGVLKFQLVQVKDQIYVLNALSQMAQNNTDKIQIDNQIKFLQEEQKKVENVLEQKNQFSLFGWFTYAL
jgi:hypothetical protein